MHKYAHKWAFVLVGNSWSLHHYLLLWLYQFLIFAPLLTFIIRVVLSVLRGGPKSLPALSFNALIFPILRIVCTISFHYSCPWISSMSCTILGQVWYLIVSIPDLCTITYFCPSELLSQWRLCPCRLLSYSLKFSIYKLKNNDFFKFKVYLIHWKQVSPLDDTLLILCYEADRLVAVFFILQKKNPFYT